MSRPRSPARRTVAAITVVALHVVLVRVLLLNATVRGGLPPNNLLQVMLIAPDETRPPEPLPEPTPPEAPPMSTAALAIAGEDAPSTPASFMAVTTPGRDAARGTPDAALPVVEAINFDTDALKERCALAYPESAADLEVDGSLTLLVRVEPNGRPSETKIVASSGLPELDDAVGACLLSLGSFEPVMANEHAVGSWRRVTWRRRPTP
jgi:TonB family protein